MSSRRKAKASPKAGTRLRLVGTNEERGAVLDEALAQLREHERKHLVADFDAQLEEYQRVRTPHLVKFAGRVFEIPRSTPFDFAMFYNRHCMRPAKDGSGSFTMVVPEQHVAEFCRLMLGEEFVRHAERLGVEFGFVLERIVPSVLRLWGVDIQQGIEDAEKKTATTPGS